MAAVFSVVSGEMGAALIRRDWGETLDDMAQNFPWQFAGNLQKWAGRWDDLPVDQHMLIALCAPRPVYVNGGLTDQWSDPKGEFLAMVAAGPVYRLLGGKDLGVTELPPLDTPVTERRPGLPLSQRRPHGGPGRLEGLPRLRRAAFPGPRGAYTEAPSTIARRPSVGPPRGPSARALVRSLQSCAFHQGWFVEPSVGLAPPLARTMEQFVYITEYINLC